MKKQRLLSLLLTLLLVLTAFLGGCGKDTGKTTGSSDANPAATSSATAESTTEKESPTETEGSTTDGEEYFLEREEGCKQLTLYWKRDNTDYSKCDVWMWFPGKDGRGYAFYPCAYGVKCMINVPEEVDSVGFIVRYNCSDPCGTSWGDATKDYDADRFADVSGGDTEVYLLPGDENLYASNDGGKTLTVGKELRSAFLVDVNQIRYYVNPATEMTDLSQFHVKLGGKEVALESATNLNNSVITGVITLKEEADLTDTYTLSIDGFADEVTVLPTQIFDSASFAEKYHYDGDDLGAVINSDGATTFKVWAPTASEVLLNLFEDGAEGKAFETITMERGDKGVYSATTASAGHGTYYTYTVTTAAGKQEAVDPYAKAAGVNGNRGMVVDLRTTDPAGFRDSGYVNNIETYEDAILWEVHVRDFSNRMKNSAYPGKYLAFTETGLTNSDGEKIGVDYVKDLGITHIHLQPVYDYATVDETSPEDEFNWGYDPKNYNVPEGSYATDPYHGEVRINEFKQMVKSLHDKGLGVVMDVVYNHTYDANANLNKIVPYYYYRYNSKGENSNGSGCGNETASDRYMFRKFMVDSVTYWAEEYKIDGFRFDLMALHDVDTMQAIEQAVHSINPKGIIYGEGWTGGTTTLNPNAQMNQDNVKKITRTEGAAGTIAVFNDVIRDGLKGSVFDSMDTGYINGTVTSGTAGKVTFSLAGGKKAAGASWSVNDSMIINYMSCHDNNTLWDKLEISRPDASVEERLAMNRLGASIVMLSKGTPFWLAGEEFLRTKDGDHNSYKSSDAVNNIDWEVLKKGSDAKAMADFYKALITLRKTYIFMRDPDVEVTTEVAKDQSILMVWSRNGEALGAALINPTDKEVQADLPAGEFSRVFYNNAADATGLGGVISAAPMSVSVAEQIWVVYD